MANNEQKIIEFIDAHQEDLIQIAKDLISYETISSAPDANERYDRIVAYLDKTFKDMGMEGKVVRRSEKGGPNFVCTMKGKGGGKNVGMGGHTDVVPATEPNWITGSGYKAEVIDGKLYGRGAADMKGGLAACIMAMRALHELKIPLSGDVSFVGAVDEEVGGNNGMAYVVESGAVDVSYFINAEQTNIHAMTGYKGTSFYRVKVTGVSAHGSTPHLGVNAIEKAMKIIYAIKLGGFTWTEHPFLGKSSYNVGTIQGGTATNVVPGECTFTMDVRLTEGMTPEGTRAELEAMLARMMREDPDLKAEVTYVEEPTMPTVISDDNEFVQVLKACGKEVTGKNLATDSFISSGDMEHFLVRGIPGIMCGPGSLKDIHKLNEFCLVEELVNAAKIYALAITRLCN